MRRFFSILTVMVLVASGCSEAVMEAFSLNTEPAVATPKPSPSYREPRITHETSGANLALEVVDGTWLQSDGGLILGLDPATGAQLWSIDLGGAGSTGIITSMVTDGNRLIVVLDGDAVVELNLGEASLPTIRTRHDGKTLGIVPRRVVGVGDDVWIIGDGGVYDYLRGTLMPTDRVVHTLARLDDTILISDGQLIHALGESDPVTGGVGVCTVELGGRKRLLTWHQGETGGVIRLRGEELTETVGDPLVVLGGIEQVIPHDAGIWVVTSRQVLGASVSPSGLIEEVSFPIRGGVDVAAIDDNYLAISGTFGRAIYRIHDDVKGEGDVFLNVQRMPGELHAGTWDGLHLLAGSDEGAWRYLIGRRAELVADRLSLYGEGEQVDIFGSSKVEVVDSGRAVVVRHGQDQVRIEAGSRGRFSLVTVEGDRAWVVHGRGILMIQERPADLLDDEGNPIEHDADAAAVPMAYRDIDTRIQGPITMLQPLAYGGGVAYASLYGGFGVLEMVLVEQAPPRDAPENSQ